jgi:hypothetical protein
MNILSVLGATASLECAILLIAVVLFLDLRRTRRNRRLLRSMQSTLAAASQPPAREESRQPKAA